MKSIFKASKTINNESRSSKSNKGKKLKS